jgi:hypothetical protein
LSVVPDLPIVDERASDDDMLPPADHRHLVINFFAERGDPKQLWSASEISKVIGVRAHDIRLICRGLMSEGLVRIKSRRYAGLLGHADIADLLMQALGPVPATPGALAMQIGLRRHTVSRVLWKMAVDGRIRGRRRAYSLLAANDVASA